VCIPTLICQEREPTSMPLGSLTILGFFGCDPPSVLDELK
jgi:hypothetical protein